MGSWWDFGSNNIYILFFVVSIFRQLRHGDVLVKIIGVLVSP
jgi:hypothetical protein